jgi:LPS O-antigen subunit length determinant protein (WzzB/FepE family)
LFSFGCRASMLSSTDFKALASEVEEIELETPRRLWPFVWGLLGMAFLGVVLALIWHNIDPQRWSATQLLPSFAAQPTATTGTAGSAEQAAELDTLKKAIDELRASQRQMAFSIAALQVAQQELQQRSSFKSTYWYSEPDILMRRIVTAQAKQKSTPRPRSETRDANVAREDQRAPLPLVSARP